MTQETENSALEPVSIEIPVDEPQKNGAETEKPVSRPDPEADLESLKATIETHKRAVEEARQQTLAERAAREEAERRAFENERYAQAATAQAQDGRLTAISNAIRAMNSEAENAERALSEALSAGDSAMAAKAQRHLAGVEARLLQLENGKAALEEQLQEQVQRLRQQQQQPQPQRREPQQNVDPVEQWASTLSKPSADWVRSNADALRDQRVVRKIGAAHSYAVDVKGIEPDTPEYFNFIEQEIGLRQHNDSAAENKEQPRTSSGQFAPKKPVPAAPVSSAGASSGRTRGETITLSAEMRDVAHSMYSDMSPQDAERQYAMDRAAMIKSGRLSS